MCAFSFCVYDILSRIDPLCICLSLSLSAASCFRPPGILSFLDARTAGGLDDHAPHSHSSDAPADAAASAFTGLDCLLSAKLASAATATDDVVGGSGSKALIYMSDMSSATVRSFDPITSMSELFSKQKYIARLMSEKNLFFRR